MSFRLVPKLVTLNDLEQRNSPNLLLNFTKFSSFQEGLRKSGWRYTDTFCGKNVGQSILFIAIYYSRRYWQGIAPSESVKVSHPPSR